jgi:hypothetical protein
MNLPKPTGKTNPLFSNWRLPLAALCLALVMTALAMALTGCGDDRETVTQPIWRPDLPPPLKSYSTSPESTSELLKDTSEAVKAKSPSHEAVHFTLASSTTVGGKSESVRAEGDFAFPDGVRMTQRDYLAADAAPVEVIAIGGDIYSRSSATAGAWRKGNTEPPPPEPQSIANYLDFARSSRNFGEETLGDGRKTWHVQVDVDSKMLVDEAMKRTTDQAALQALEFNRSAAVTVDFWIGSVDRVPYQMLVKVSNPVSGSTREQEFVFSDWRQYLELTRPCESC